MMLIMVVFRTCCQSWHPLGHVADHGNLWDMLLIMTDFSMFYQVG